MKFINRPILLIYVVLLSLLSACDSLYEDGYECIQGINVSFYSKTLCQTDTVYPEQVKDITLCVFDKNGVLVSYQKSNDITLQRDYSQQVQVNGGLYTVMAWSGLDGDHYDLTALQTGATTKSDLLFRLKRAAGLASSIEGTRIYYGESPAVYVEQATGSEPIFENTTINMLEMTNRITVLVEGLARAEDYQIEIESDNGSMNIDGSIAQDDVLEHTAEHIVREGTLESTFTLLKLETGHNNTLIIKSRLDGRELYRGSLLGTLLLKNPDVNLACDHDFRIRFTAEDQCNCGTYMIAKIWVNNWLVHSYDTEI